MISELIYFKIYNKEDDFNILFNSSQKSYFR